MLKKFFSICFFIIFIICLYSNIYANDNVSYVKMYINNELYTFDENPINIDGYTYISINDVNKIFGYNYNIEKDDFILSYDEYENIIDADVLSDEGLCLNLYIENALFGNAYCYNNTIYVPLRVAANRNGCDIYWYAEDNSINLNYNISNIFGREMKKAIIYFSRNGIDYDYIFVVYNNQVDASKSVLMIKYFGNFDHEFSNVKELFSSISVDDIIDRKVIDIDSNEYSELMEKIDNLLNDELKGNASPNGYDLPICDYVCYIV